MDYLPKGGKLDLKPKRHHGYNVLLFILGTLFPPLAVAARFGIGKDFWLNLFLTICGYFPGHGHNFYIQNIRNNKNRARTPKWAVRYGLVDTTVMDRKKKRSEWATRYNERLPNSTYEGRELEEGQVPDRPVAPDEQQRRVEPGLWRDEDEQYYGSNGGRREYGESSASLESGNSSGRWHYPANFDDAVVEGSARRKKKSKKDRWAMTEEAYAQPDDGSARRRSKKKKRTKTQDDAGASNYYEPGEQLDAGYDPAPSRPPATTTTKATAVNSNGHAEARDEFAHQF